MAQHKESSIWRSNTTTSRLVEPSTNNHAPVPQPGIMHQQEVQAVLDRINQLFQQIQALMAMFQVIQH